jgi:DNA-binding PadR family transcriptional regulator
MTTPHLGDLQHLVMVAVARLGHDAFGGAIQDELRDVAGREVSVSTVYVTLVRLEEQGLVESGRGQKDTPSVGRPRRVFRVTADGWAALRAARASLERIWEGVEPA